MALVSIALALLGTAPALADDPGSDSAAAPAQSTAPSAESGESQQPAQTSEPVPTTSPAPAPVDPAPAEVPAPAEAPAAAPPSTADPAEPAPEAPVAEIPAPDPTAPPFLRWTAVDGAGTAQSGAAFTVQGVRDDAVVADGTAEWASAITATVADNTGQAGYAGADLDPAPGAFLVKQVVSDADPSSVHEVAAAESYRVRPANAAGFKVGDDAGWTELGSSATADQASGSVVLVAQPQVASRALAAPLATVLADCGTTTSCAELRITTTVTGGGPATASAWSLHAVSNNAGADDYPFTSGTARTVPNGAVYTLSATADPEIQKLYTTTFSCTGGTNGLAPTSGAQSNNRTTANTNARTVTFGSSGNLTPSGRYARCTFTQAFTGVTKIHITKVGDRTGSGTTAGAPLDGVVFDAYASTSGGSAAPTGPSLGSCITSGGSCDITVPSDTTAYASGIWVQETSAPAGWTKISGIGTGNYDSAKTNTPYRFRVAIGTAGTTTTRNVTADKNLPNSNVSGAWVNARNNPGFPQACGVSIAMVFDTSASISQSEMTSFKNAASDFVGNNGLGTTPSSVTMFSFDTTASKMNGGTPFQLATAGSASGNGGTGYLGAQNAIDRQLPSSGNSSGYTNWDAALQLVKSTGSYDMVLFLTDGDPTTYGGGSDRNTNVQFLMVEQAAMSANAVKAATGPAGGNTKIVGVGVGLSTNSYLNLQAITGPSEGEDYFLASDFANLKNTLHAIAVKNCASTLTVIKQIQNPDGSVKTANAAGWQFTATGDVVNGSPATKTTTDSGTNFQLTFNDTANHTVAVDETAQNGYTYIGTTCTNAAGTVTKTTTGFTVPVKSGLITSCTVMNREVQQTAAVKVSKTWVINDGSGHEVLRTHQPAQSGDPALPDGISAQLGLTGPGSSGSTSQAWGTPRDGYTVGDQVTVSETTSIDASKLPNCTVSSQKLTKANGEAKDLSASNGAFPAQTLVARAGTTPPNLNEYEVTNTITCATKLTLLKKVDGGSASPSAWDLTAKPSGGSGTTVAGSDAPSAANTFPVAAGTGYALSEALHDQNSQIAYLLDRVEQCTAFGAGGSCNSWATVSDVSNVKVSLGQTAMYRFVNKAAPAIAVPLTGGIGRDQVLLAGGGVLILSLAILGLMRARRRRFQGAL